MTDELIEALRGGVDGDPDIGLAPANDTMRKAADRIQSQAAEIERLRETNAEQAQIIMQLQALTNAGEQNG